LPRSLRRRAPPVVTPKLLPRYARKQKLTASSMPRKLLWLPRHRSPTGEKLRRDLPPKALLARETQADRHQATKVANAAFKKLVKGFVSR
jgi:hypothetical protein